MAIQLNLTAENTKLNVPLNSVYARISSLRGNKTTFEYNVQVFINETSANPGEDVAQKSRPIRVDNFQFPITDIDNTNLMEFCYNHLKTQTLYNEGTDV